MKKNEQLKQLLIKNIKTFRCPICMGEITLTNNSLVCANNHTYDISKKGELYLYRTSKLKNDPVYDESLFINRAHFINLGFYDEVHKYIYDIINKLDKAPINILDMGCGEGTHDIKIKRNIKNVNNFVGIDISRDGVSLATSYLEQDYLPVLGDIHNLPIADNSIDVVLNILSPSNEEQIKRILKVDGIVIKVIPQKDYLKELREAFGIDEYSNSEIIYQNINQKYIIQSEVEYQKTFNISEEDLTYLFKMTPLLKNKNYDETSSNIKTITISLKILVLQIKGNQL